MNLRNFRSRVIEITPTVDTSIYADGDVLFVPNAITLSTSEYGESTTDLEINDIRVTDDEAQDAAIDILFLVASSAPSVGSLNGAVSATATDVKGVIPISASDYRTVGDGAVAVGDFAPFTISIPSGSTLYIAGVSRGTPTYNAASDLTVQVGIRNFAPLP